MSYEIEFLKPRILPGTGGNFNGSGVFDHFQIFNSAIATPGVLPATPFGTGGNPIYPTTQSTLGGVVCGGICTTSSFAPAAQPTGNNFLGGIPVLNGSGQPTGALGPSTINTYYFPPGVASGVYLFVISDKFGANPGALVVQTNLVNTRRFNGFALQPTGTPNASFLAFAGGVFNQNIAYTIAIQVTNVNAAVSLTFTGSPTVPQACDLYVVYLAQNVN